MLEALGSLFANPDYQASSNYGIGKDGRLGMYVEEQNRSWCSSNGENDNRAVTIECASDMTDPYAMNGDVYDTLIKLCADICRRNGKTKLLWLEDKDKTLSYAPASDEMVLTVHRWFANKACPGNWLDSRLGELAEKVTVEVSGTEEAAPPSNEEKKKYYRVQLGAFSVRANAEAMLAKVKTAGFEDAFIKYGD